jgi:hypothetical protein
LVSDFSIIVGENKNVVYVHIKISYFKNICRMYLTIPIDKLLTFRPPQYFTSF